MSQFYSNPEHEDDACSLPDAEVFQLTAREVAERDDDLIHQYMKRHEFRLAAMNSRVREAMFEAMVEEEGIAGGWFYWYSLPGCMPDSDPIGPYETRNAAVEACRDESDEY